MNESIISVRYTKSIFALANEKGIIDTVKSDMENIFAIMNESEELMLVFQNPVLKPSNKQEVINQLFGKSFHPITLSFINLLIKNRREEYLHDISRNFLQKYRQMKGIETGTFTTAVTIKPETLEMIRVLIKKAMNVDVELNSSVDSKIMGGFVLRVGDTQYDASVQSNLNKIKRKLLNTTVN
jgi:F-type H+-transporting ATPase subunit delta